MIVFMVFICWREEFLINRQITKMAKAISDLVFIIENIKNLVIF